MKAELKVLVTVRNPIAGEEPVTIENVQDVTYDDDNKLMSYTHQQVAKIMHEGGFLSIDGKFDVSLIPYHEICKIRAVAEPKAVLQDTNVAGAVKDAAQARKADDILRGKVTEFPGKLLVH